MEVFIVGKGKLASELLKELHLEPAFKVMAWRNGTPSMARAIIVHAGSGRELQEVMAFCQRTNSILIELA
ncbi:MAG TPA: dihydrodipicolinate reductase, partial [Bacillota bacterium]|nr:dihydrodipicolinate reductase [Bacillota bacterium]